MTNVTPAQKYIEVHGKSVENWIAAYIEAFFGRIEMGQPRAVSEFGVVYDGHVCELDATQGHELMMAALKLMVTQSMPPNPKSCTLVWRVLPEVYNRGPDFETNQSWPNVVRVRYRCHTIEGTTDFKLNELKAAQVAKEWSNRTMELSRRNLFGLGAAALAAPAIIKVEALMKLSRVPLILPSADLVADFSTDDLRFKATERFARGFLDPRLFRQIVEPVLREHFDKVYDERNKEYDRVFRVLDAQLRFERARPAVGRRGRGAA